MKIRYGLAMLVLLSPSLVLAATIKVLASQTTQQRYTLDGNKQHELKIEPIKTEIILYSDIPPVLIKTIAASLRKQKSQYQWKYTALDGFNEQQLLTFNLTPNMQKPVVFTGKYGELGVSPLITTVNDLDDAVFNGPHMTEFAKQYCTEAFVPIGKLHQYIELNDSKQVNIEKDITLKCQRAVPNVEISVLSPEHMSFSGEESRYTEKVTMGFLARNGSLSRDAFTVTATYGSGFTCVSSSKCFLNRLDYDISPENRIGVVLRTETRAVLQNGRGVQMRFDLAQNTLVKKEWTLDFYLKGESIAPGTYKGTINFTVHII